MKKLQEVFKNYPEILRFMIFVIGAILLIYFTNNLIGIFAPFLIAYIITLVTRPILKFLNSKLKFPKAVSAIICLFIMITLGGLIIWFFANQIIAGITYIVNIIGVKFTSNNIMSILQEVDSKLKDVGTALNIDLDIVVVSNEIYNLVKNMISSLSNISLGIAMNIPGIIVAFIIGCLASFYMLFDYDRITGFFNKQLSKNTKKIIYIFNHNVMWSIFKMMFSYIILSIICFLEIAIGFLILGVKDAWFLAFLIAVLDVLPILGSGGILVPWSIIGFLTKNPVIGFGMLILWGVIVLVRQILEPKIVGSQIGLHPLITIMALFIGLKTMGGLGLLMAPLYVIVCKKMNEAGIINLYKE